LNGCWKIYSAKAKKEGDVPVCAPEIYVHAINYIKEVIS
jgi:hypothetical protein